MNLRHKIHVNVNADGTETPVMSGADTTIRKRRLKKFLMGDKVNVLVVTPEESATTVEIHEIEEGCESDGKNHGRKTEPPGQGCKRT